MGESNVLTPERAEILLADWDRQQEMYVPERASRLAAVAETLEVLIGPAPRVMIRWKNRLERETPFLQRLFGENRINRVLDLGCGPGTLGSRIRRRLPAARVTGIDHDPLLLALGRAAEDGGRGWIDGDLARPGWSEPIAAGPFDAAVSATALHWLAPEVLAAVYREVRTVLRPGGVLINADLFAYEAEQPVLGRLAEEGRLRHRRRSRAEGKPDWEEWWREVAAEPALATLVAERHRRFATTTKHLLPPSRHTAMLRAAGFAEVGPVWQRLNHMVLVAVA